MENVKEGTLSEMIMSLAFPPINEQNIKTGTCMKKRLSQQIGVEDFFNCFIRSGNFNTSTYCCPVGQWSECPVLILTFRVQFPAHALRVEKAKILRDLML